MSGAPGLSHVDTPGAPTWGIMKYWRVYKIFYKNYFRQQLIIENREDLPFAYVFDKIMDVNTEGKSVVSVQPISNK